MLIKVSPCLVVVGTSAWLVLTWSEGPETKRALTGAARRVAPRRTAPPTRRSDIVDGGVKEWGVEDEQLRQLRCCHSYGGRCEVPPYGTIRKWLSVAWRQGHPDFPSNSRFSPSSIVSRSPVPITLRIAVRSLPTLSRHSLPRAAFIATKFLTSSSPDKMSYIARRGLSTLIPPKVRPPRIEV